MAQDGSFLVRPNITDATGFVLSVKLHNTISHLKIVRCGGLNYTIEVDGKAMPEKCYAGKKK